MLKIQNIWVHCQYFLNVIVSHAKFGEVYGRLQNILRSINGLIFELFFSCIVTFCMLFSSQ